MGQFLLYAGMFLDHARYLQINYLIKPPLGSKIIITIPLLQMQKLMPRKFKYCGPIND